MTEALVSGSLVGGRYRLDRVLGEGGMGVVWAATQVVTRKSVALKLIKGLADSGPLRARLLREARAACAVSHPNVREIYDFIELPDGAPVMVMEYLVGESLGERLQRVGKLSLADAAAIIVQAASAVGAAHARGIVHRDLKPENVFLVAGPAGVVKVLDFGIAKLNDPEDEAAATALTETGTRVGTPCYMSPEQAFSEKDVDHRADIWAIGLILYQCLTGVVPTMADSVGQVLKNIVARPIGPVEELAPDLPPEVTSLIGRSLLRRREERPASLAEVVATLSAFTEVRVPLIEAPMQAARDERPNHASDAPEAAETGDPRGAPAPMAAPADAVVSHAATPPAGALDGSSEASASTSGGRARRRVVGAAGAIAIALAIVAFAPSAWRRLRSGVGERSTATSGATAPSTSPSALVLPAADHLAPTLACPLFEVRGVEAPSGWFGAAIAAYACERARMLFGGRSERTLVPAELLQLPRAPTDDFPADPYCAPDARDRSVLAGRARSPAYLDGAVDLSGGAAHVTLVLRSREGQELARADGSRTGWPEALQIAMSRLFDEKALPTATALDPGAGEWFWAETPHELLDSYDGVFAFLSDDGRVTDLCQRLSPRRGQPRGAPDLRQQCAYTQGLEYPLDLAQPLDRSSSATLERTGLVQLWVADDLDNRALATAVEAALEREPPGGCGRALLAGFASNLQQALLDLPKAHDLAVRGIHENPRCEQTLTMGWEQLLSLSLDSQAVGASRGTAGWVPHVYFGWLQLGSTSAEKLMYAKRARVLAPRLPAAVQPLVEALAAGGRREEAHALAVELGIGGHLARRAGSEALLVKLEAQETRFRSALRRALASVAALEGGDGYVRTQRLETAAFALRLAVVLGEERHVADELSAALVEPRPTRLNPQDPSGLSGAMAICASASPSVAVRCFERIREDAAHGSFQTALQGSDALLRGGEAYARHDLPKAARAWGGLLRTPGVSVDAMADVIASTFDQVGDAELADRVDKGARAHEAELGGAAPATIRTALRAEKRGDHAQARELARQVVAAWESADEPGPGYDQMKRLLARER